MNDHPNEALSGLPPEERQSEELFIGSATPRSGAADAAAAPAEVGVSNESEGSGPDQQAVRGDNLKNVSDAHTTVGAPPTR